MKKFLLLTIAGAITFTLSALGLIVWGNDINWSIFWSLLFILGIRQNFLLPGNWSRILLIPILVLMFLYLIRITSSNVAFTSVFFILIILAWKNHQPDKK